MKKDKMDYDSFDDPGAVMTACLTVLAVILLVVTFPLWTTWIAYCSWEERRQYT